MNRNPQFFKNNANLKACGVAVEYTPEQVEEYQKCMNDCVYFMKNYVYIITLDKSFQKFDVYPAQERLIDLIDKNRNIIALKGRQQGISTTVVMYFLWKILFNDTYQLGILANRAASAKGTLQRLKNAYQRLPFWLQQGVREWTKTKVELENGSWILADSTSGNAGRSYSYNEVFIDEFCFVERNLQEEFMRAIIPTISTSETSKIIIASTPNGMEYFYGLWKEAKAGTNDYVAYESPWWEIPGRDEAWKQKMVKKCGSIENFEQEFECSFLNSQSTLLSSSVMKRMSGVRPVRSENGFNVFNEPVKGHTYIITVDPSRGQSLDHHAFSVIDATEMPYTQVARYQNNKTELLVIPTLVVAAARYYNDAYILVEINSSGIQVANQIINDLEYENVFRVKPTNRGQQMTFGAGANIKVGLDMSAASKAIGCSNLKAMIEANQLIVQDAETIYEFTSFVEKGKSFAAQDGCHDDLVMSLVVFGWLAAQKNFKEFADKDIRVSLEHFRQQMISETMPIGGRDDGLNEEKAEPTMISNGLVWLAADDPEHMEFVLRGGLAVGDDIDID